MDYLVYMVVPLLGGLLLYAFTHSFVRAGGNALQKKFISLGNMTGKTYDEIAAVVGGHNSESPVGDGTIIRQWMLPGYHIALIFDKDNKCIGKSYESSV